MLLLLLYNLYPSICMWFMSNIVLHPQSAKLKIVYGRYESNSIILLMHHVSCSSHCSSSTCIIDLSSSTCIIWYSSLYCCSMLKYLYHMIQQFILLLVLKYFYHIWYSSFYCCSSRCIIVCSSSVCIINCGSSSRIIWYSSLYCCSSRCIIGHDTPCCASSSSFSRSFIWQFNVHVQYSHN